MVTPVSSTQGTARLGTGSKALKALKRRPKEHLTLQSEHIALLAFAPTELPKSLRKRFIDPAKYCGYPIVRDRFDGWMVASGWHGWVRTDCYLGPSETGQHPIEEVRDWLEEGTHGRFTAYCWNGGKDDPAFDHWYLFFWFEEAADAVAMRLRFG